MILQKFNLITIILPILFIVLFLIWRYFKKSHEYIAEYWFFKTSGTSYASMFFLLISLVFLGFSLLDLRGEEEKVTAQVPDQKTIILIDSSMSMLVEDVRPNRFIKSLQVARHYVKNSSANQFSVFIFSDTFQRILPFTDDIDLVDSRLAALESLATVKGSSNIGYTVKGMIPYLKNESGDGDAVGNILLLTDGEDHDRFENLNIPKEVSLAVIGVGTARGGQIPIRWNDGSFKGFKTVSGTPVVSRLNEKYIKNLGDGVSDFEYWIVNSFNLPTNEIIDFFRNKYIAGGAVGEARARKSYGEYPIALFILCYVLSVVFSRFKTFKAVSAVVLCVLGFSLMFSPQILMAEESEERKISDETLKMLEKVKSGESNRSEVLKTAELLLAEGFPETSAKLYREHVTENDSVEVKSNYATSLVKSKKVNEGIKIFKDILQSNELGNDQANSVRKNLLAAIQQKKSQEQKNNQSDENQKNENQSEGNKSQDQGNSSQKGNSNSDKDQKNENKNDQSNKSNNKNNKGSSEEKDLRDLMNKDKSKDKSKNEGQEKDSKEKNDQEKSDQEKNDENKKDQKGDKKGEEDKGKREPEKVESFEEREDRLKKQRKMKKTPAILKQTLDLDRELQKKFLDASREKLDNDKTDTKPSKDW